MYDNDTSFPTTSRAAELRFSDIHEGDDFRFRHAFTQQDVERFAQVSGDYSPLHIDPQYAATTEFGRCVVHGMLLASLFSNLVGMRIPGKQALYLGQDLTFRRPVLVGEVVEAIAKVTAKAEATRTITLATEIRTADGRVAVSGSARVKVREGAANTGAQEPVRSSVERATFGEHARPKVAFVSGGSGGLGSAIARKLGSRGIAVAVNCFRHPDRAQQLVSAIRQDGGVGMVVPADIRDSTELRRALDQVIQTLGAPTIIVNAASGPLDVRPAAELGWNDYLQHLEFQVKASAEISRAVYPYMKTAGGGSIVNVVSQVAAGSPASRMADYVTAKYALLGLSKALAVEWAADQIRVNMVSPGLVQTELTQHYHDKVFKMEAARNPLKRLPTPEDVAQAVAFLASDDASYLTGVNLLVSGGQVMI